MSEAMRQKLAVAMAAMDSGKISAAELEVIRQTLLREENKIRNYSNPTTSLNPSVSRAFKSRR